MPRSPSPERSRRRSASPSREPRRDRSRSPPPKQWSQRKAKELSFYKKGGAAPPPPRAPGAPYVEEEETAKDRAQRRERGEVPRRFGGSREQGVRNTMGNVVVPVASAPGSFKRTGDPLDRLGVRGEPKDREYRREERRDDRSDRDRYRDRDDRRDRDRDRDRGDRRDRDRDDRREHRSRDDRERPSAASTAQPPQRPPAPGSSAPPTIRPGRMIEVIANDRMGRKVRVKCLPTDTVGDLKRLIAAQTGTSAQKIQLKKWYTMFKDHVTLEDYEINDGMVSVDVGVGGVGGMLLTRAESRDVLGGGVWRVFVGLAACRDATDMHYLPMDALMPTSSPLQPPLLLLVAPKQLLIHRADELDQVVSDHGALLRLPAAARDSAVERAGAVGGQEGDVRRELGVGRVPDMLVRAARPLEPPGQQGARRAGQDVALSADALEPARRALHQRVGVAWRIKQRRQGLAVRDDV
ncbi:hypothetical protein VHUM_02446 [Vanrija humicola]|uniref:Ubiquitin-like modifier HUB1 n=1 Tax=Vanrija humicola TaxID=5417 RepID=A0A7D8V0B5_VANHU|nr:hypothetical protein VHUM_02446 [Vanrija humicola]